MNGMNALAQVELVLFVFVRRSGVVDNSGVGPCGELGCFSTMLTLLIH
jgi:hypothetical protein